MSKGVGKLEELPSKYPELFKNSRFDDVDSSPFFYFQCGDGWYTLLDTLLRLIKARLSRWNEVKEIVSKSVAQGEEPAEWAIEYLKSNPTNPLDGFVIHQIKEKYGGLRFYWGGDGLSEESSLFISGATTLAESLSYTICEECGNRGTVEGRDKGWISTLCDGCRKCPDQLEHTNS